MMRLRLLVTGAILAVLFLLQPLDMAARPAPNASPTMSATSALATRLPTLAATVDLRPWPLTPLATPGAPPALPAGTAKSDRPGPGGRPFAY